MVFNNVVIGETADSYGEYPAPALRFGNIADLAAIAGPFLAAIGALRPTRNGSSEKA